MGKIAGLSDQREILRALRDRLASVLDGDVGHKRGCDCECGVPPDMRTIPSTAKELREVVRDLADMPNAAEGVDELAALKADREKRQAAARLAGSADPPEPRVRQQRRTGSDPAGRNRRVGA